MNRYICLLLVLIFTLSACSVQTEPEPTEHINWSVVEEIGRDGDEVHYRIHLSNGMTVDGYTREVEQ